MKCLCCLLKNPVLIEKCSYWSGASDKKSHIWWIQAILLQRQSKAAGGPMKKESISSLTFALKK